MRALMNCYVLSYVKSTSDVICATVFLILLSMKKVMHTSILFKIIGMH